MPPPATPASARRFPTPPLSGRRAVHSDRFIPSRTTTNLEEALDLLDSSSKQECSHENQSLMNTLLRSELLGQSTPERRTTEGVQQSPSRKDTVLKYRSSTGSIASDSSHTRESVFSASPATRTSLGPGTGTTLPRGRKIPKTPFKMLDAPQLQDDYYLNLVDWSSTNILAVALGSAVYLWSACTSKAALLADFHEETVTSISWATAGSHISVGTSSGKVQIWDASAGAVVREMAGHESRVGVMAWSSAMLASGSRDRSIHLQDVRIRGAPRSRHGVSSTSSSSDEMIPVATSNLSSSLLRSPLRAMPLPLFSSSSSSSPAGHAPCIIRSLSGHRQEVCGLKWSMDESMLASGGNDNKLFVWQPSSSAPLHRFEDHTAAVKAVAWSPHQAGLLASGGGTADRHIRFWNATTGTALHKMDTQSQVCNLMWSKNSPELVSTHGYSLNQVIVWKYPSMQKTATLSGHTLR